MTRTRCWRKVPAPKTGGDKGRILAQETGDFAPFHRKVSPGRRTTPADSAHRPSSTTRLWGSK